MQCSMNERFCVEKFFVTIPIKNNDLFWKVTKNVVHNTNNRTGQMKKVISYPNNITILLLKKSPRIEQ